MSDNTSAKKPKRARKDEAKAERRDAILDAAERVLARRGWELTHYGEVAREAGLSRALVYVYFPERDDLIQAVCSRGLAVLAARFEAALARHRSGLEQVMAIGRAYHGFAIEEPLYFEVLSHMQAKETDVHDDTNPAHVHGQDCLGAVARALANGLADGSVRAGIGDPGATAVAIWAFTHGLIQISSRKEEMLKADFNLTATTMMEHGFNLMRGSLAAEKS